MRSSSNFQFHFFVVRNDYTPTHIQMKGRRLFILFLTRTELEGIVGSLVYRGLGPSIDSELPPTNGVPRRRSNNKAKDLQLVLRNAHNV
jgi:hypothetical protein